MRYKGIVVAILTVIVGCMGSTQLQACEIKLQVKNFTSFMITAVQQRKPGADTWSGNLIETPIGSNGTKIVLWQGDGDYELEIEFTNRPVIKTVEGICDKSQIIANSNGVVIQ